MTFFDECSVDGFVHFPLTQFSHIALVTSTGGIVSMSSCRTVISSRYFVEFVCTDLSGITSVPHRVYFKMWKEGGRQRSQYNNVHLVVTVYLLSCVCVCVYLTEVTSRVMQERWLL